jgi:hypothetical protein
VIVRQAYGRLVHSAIHWQGTFELAFQGEMFIWKRKIGRRWEDATF